MIVVLPGWFWRGGPVRRAVSVGLPAGVFFGAFVLAESGAWVGAVAAVLVLGPFYGIRVARRMGRIWPGARDLDPADRSAVVRAARRGEDIGDARLAPAVIDYCDGLRTAREQDRLLLWVTLVFAGLAVALAVIDTSSGSTREAWVSWVFVLFFLVELTWWPRRQTRIMSRAEQAERSARRLVRQRNSAGE
ncbi:hypothetical protein [Streptomyces diastatochromogenes]|uniref:hypothetical protein n=1 Tax=Streptomyces diastatochromogenes TaxID=42236 RepID=UPI0036C154BE